MFANSKVNLIFKFVVIYIDNIVIILQSGVRVFEQLDYIVIKIKRL